MLYIIWKKKIAEYENYVNKIKGGCIKNSAD
jgi:hypothetical protein